ncbi:MAG TPA: hypothetical protein VFA26_15070, partial [Gemmataceae bacterium]|nr:hypothetical protein [Gemmataceae bacterium]
PYISRISGQAGYNGGLNFITDKYGMKGTNGMNLSGVSQDFGLHPGVTGNLQLLGAIGGFGSPAPAGNYTTSPFMNMLIGSMGGPVGSQPQTRITYAGGPTVAPPFMAGWRPIGWQG